MAKQPHFPFPKRTSTPEKNIIYIKDETFEYLQHCWEKNTSNNSITIANQYFAIEEILKESFLYVTPIKSNANTSSSRFATIIRESCNFYEILCRKAYSEFFEFDEKQKLNIFNYLSLEYFFKINQEELRSATFYNYLGADERIKPFSSLKNWTGTNEILPENIPSWWRAYNKIKHDSESYVHYATLDNAILSIAALFLVIRKIYGDGLVSGWLRKPTKEQGINAHIYPIRNSDVFIGEIFKSMKRR